MYIVPRPNLAASAMFAKVGAGYETKRPSVREKMADNGRIRSDAETKLLSGRSRGGHWGQLPPPL